MLEVHRRCPTSSEAACLPAIAELTVVAQRCASAVRQRERVIELAILSFRRNGEMRVYDQIKTTVAEGKRIPRVGRFKRGGRDRRSRKKPKDERNAEDGDPDERHCGERRCPDPRRLPAVENG